MMTPVAPASCAAIALSKKLHPPPRYTIATIPLTRTLKSAELQASRGCANTALSGAVPNPPGLPKAATRYSSGPLAVPEARRRKACPPSLPAGWEGAGRGGGRTASEGPRHSSGGPIQASSGPKFSPGLDRVAQARACSSILPCEDEMLAAAASSPPMPRPAGISMVLSSVFTTSTSPPLASEEDRASLAESRALALSVKAQTPRVASTMPWSLLLWS
mmetsp:Transcript_12526/g.36311  ORF Transcript_12526/g.36311 Transcript_12526/m.36311 type:complete len:218 (+) Transcript_12526:425-1078(+)